MGHPVLSTHPLILHQSLRATLLSVDIIYECSLDLLGGGDGVGVSVDHDLLLPLGRRRLRRGSAASAS